MEHFPQHELTYGCNTYSNGSVAHTPYNQSDTTDTTMPKLVKALGGQSAFEALPVLDLDTCTANGGGTGYIDFVRPGDMSSSIMRGEDKHGRPFVAFRVKSDKLPTHVETMFRRYITGPVWTSGGGSSKICCSAMDREVLERIALLSRNGSATYTSMDEVYDIHLA